MEINERIKALRIDADLTQKEMAEILNTEQSYYAKYENGKHPIPTAQIIKICRHFKVSADYILGLPYGLTWPRKIVP